MFCAVDELFFECGVELKEVGSGLAKVVTFVRWCTDLEAITTTDGQHGGLFIAVNTIRSTVHTSWLVLRGIGLCSFSLFNNPDRR